MDFGLIVLAGILNYAFLRSKGGKGISISAQLAPAHTAQGKKDRLIGAALTSFSIAVFALVFIHQNSYGQLSAVAVPTLMGAAVFLGSYLINRK
jgi:hypothetical protein